MQRLLDPTLDVVFKLLFTRHDDAHEALIGLLTAVLRPTQAIASVEILDPSVGLDDIDDKSIVLDVRVRFQDGTTLNVEMQARNVETFRVRLLYYWARLFGGQLRAGEGYGSLRPTISIALLSYLEPENPRFHSVFRILDVDDHVPYADALTIHLVQLPRLAEAAAVANRPPNDALLRWGRFFAARTTEELDQATMTDSALLKARDVLLRLSADPEVRRLAEIRELAQTTRRIEDAGLLEQGRNEGRLQELREAVVDLCELVGIAVDAERLARLETASVEALVELKRHVKLHRAWP
jgi:predicted transposase/invertase (TIGR01784 family)